MCETVVVSAQLYFVTSASAFINDHIDVCVSLDIIIFGFTVRESLVSHNFSTQRVAVHTSVCIFVIQVDNVVLNFVGSSQFFFFGQTDTNGVLQCCELKVNVNRKYIGTLPNKQPHFNELFLLGMAEILFEGEVRSFAGIICLGLNSVFFRPWICSGL